MAKLFGSRVQVSAASIMMYLPILAIVMIVLLISVFIFVVRQERLEEQKYKLIEDTLWVEQNLSFHLKLHETNLERILLDSQGAQSQSLIMTRLQHLKTIHNEVAAITWYDTKQNTLAHFSSVGVQQKPWTLAIPATRVWGFVYTTEEGQAAVDLLLPTLDANNEISGLLQVTVLLGELLLNHVPWWIVESYEVVLVGLDNEEIVRRSQNVALNPLSHTMSLDPPLHGVSVRLTPYSSPSLPLLNSLIMAVIGLAALAIINLMVQFYYARKRQQAEQALLSEKAFRSAMENSMTTGMRARDLQGKILYVNSAFCRLVGRKKEEIIGLTPPMPWWPSEVVSETQERHYLQNQMPRAQSFETRFQHSSGKILDVQVHEAPLIDTEGKHVGWMGSMIDISSRKEQEENADRQVQALQQTAHLMTLGEMTTTLAHELNQPLSVIASYAAGCLNALSDSGVDKDTLRYGIEQIALQNKRAGEIIRRTHDFVRKREPVLRPESLRGILDSCTEIMRKDFLKYRVALNYQKPSPEIQVLADKIMIEQVVLNLLNNALEAVRSLPLPQRNIQLTTQIQEGYALVIVRDTGVGVKDELVPLLFQPFTTTKSQGMGIGLNICRSIIELHRGTIWFEAIEKTGACFVFSLPIAEA